MYTPTLSISGRHGFMRIAGWTALLVSVSTGVVMAAGPGCQIAMQWQVLRAEGEIAHKAHHSAETLARWKVGAEAWSKAHHGEVYRGKPAQPVVTGWSPLRYNCDDLALDDDLATPLLTGEALPPFDVFAAAASVLPPDLSITAALAPEEESRFVDGFYTLPIVPGVGENGGRSAPVGPVGSSALPVGAQPSPPHMRLLPPKHPPLEATLLPVPLPPPTMVPTPEPSAMILFGTGIAALGLSGALRRLGS